MHLLALFLIAAAPAQPAVAPAAASDVYPTASGTAGVSFFLPGGGDPRIGGTWFISNDLAVRVDVGLNLALSPSGPGQNKLFSLGVGLRYYQFKRHHVALFLQPGVALGRENSPAVAAEAALFFRLGGAVGVEYFFTSNFSAGATLELALKLANLDGPAGTPIYTTLSTGTTGLSANIYF